MTYKVFQIEQKARPLKSDVIPRKMTFRRKMMPKKQLANNVNKWGEWKYVAPDSCKMTRTCALTGEEQWCVGPHDWGEWTPDYSNICRNIRCCLRCDKEDEKFDHQWEMSHKDGMNHSKCKRCGEGGRSWSDDEAWCSDDYH